MINKIKRLWLALWGVTVPLGSAVEEIVRQIKEQGTDALIEVAQCDGCAEDLTELPVVLVLCETCSDRITAGTLEFQRRGGNE